jgi:hypothetical protein
MKQETPYVSEAGVLMLNNCDIIYGIQWHEYETMDTQIWWLKCPAWYYERYN